MAGWRKMDSAPKNGEDILVLTSDWGIVQARWSEEYFDFYAELRGEAVIGAWISDWVTKGDTDQRLFCGASPCYWKPIGKLPAKDEDGEPVERWF